MPQVSILTPTKNAERWVAGAIASVRGQTHQDWEMIVVDDGSTDGTLAAAQRAAQGDTRVRIERSNGPAGAGGARNAGLALAQGRFIAFLDSDDLWDPSKLEIQIKAMLEHNWVFSWTAYRVEKVHANGTFAAPPYPIRHAKIHATRRDLLTKRAPVGCLTAIYDTHAFGKTPMRTIPKRQDFVLWAELMGKAEHNGWKVGGVNTPLATYRHRGDSLSGNKWEAANMQWKALVEHCGVGRVEAAKLFASYAIRGALDRLRLRLHGNTAKPTGRPPK